MKNDDEWTEKDFVLLFYGFISGLIIIMFIITQNTLLTELCGILVIIFMVISFRKERQQSNINNITSIIFTYSSKYKIPLLCKFRHTLNDRYWAMVIISDNWISKPFYCDSNMKRFHKEYHPKLYDECQFDIFRKPIYITTEGKDIDTLISELIPEIKKFKGAKINGAD